MVPASIHDFFVASGSVAGALIGLLFVAQLIEGAKVIAERDVPGAVNKIAIVMVFCFMIGIVQAWELIGGPSIGITQEITALVRGRKGGAGDSVQEESRP